MKVILNIIRLIWENKYDECCVYRLAHSVSRHNTSKSYLHLSIRLNLTILFPRIRTIPEWNRLAEETDQSKNLETFKANIRLSNCTANPRTSLHGFNDCTPGVLYYELGTDPGYSAARSFDHHPITKPEKTQIRDLCLNHLFREGPFFKPISTFYHLNWYAWVLFDNL